MFEDGIAILVLSLVWLLVAAAGYVWYAWALSRLFTRLGTDGWRGWVPVVNEMTILERGGIPAWNVVFYFIPIVQIYGLYLKFLAAQRIGQHFGRGTGMAVLGALFTPLWATLLILQRPTGTPPPQDQEVQSASHRQVAGGMTGNGHTQHAPAHQPAPPVGQPAPGFPGASDHAGHPGSVAQSFPPPAGAPMPAAHAPAASAPPPSAPPPSVPVEPALSAPPAPMPEPALPDSPAPSSAADSGPIVVHNPWARPVTAAPGAGEPATPTSPSPSQTPAWLADPASASAVVGQAVPSPLDDEDDGETVVVDRRPQVQWHLNVDGATALPLVGDKVILGRRPSATVPGTHPLAVPDTTRTLSKAHAQLELVDGEWTITDLHSTNGVLIVDETGEESLITPGEAVSVTGRFILGKVGMSISFEQDGA